MKSRPSTVVIAGPNGAGETTISKAVLADTLGIEHFVNADTIAQGLSGFAPERASFAAGRLMLRRLHELAEARESFAFETTLASRTFAPWLRDQALRGYRLHLVYVWLRSARLAVTRVQRRVRLGGHSIPSDFIRRRYRRSALNLVRLYLPIANSWIVVDNSAAGEPRLVARKEPGHIPLIVHPSTWNIITQISNG